MRNITVKQKKEFDLKAHKLFNELSDKICNLREKIKKNRICLDLLYTELKKIKSEYEQLLLSYNGGGIYYETVRKPCKIKSKIERIQNYNCYSEKMNETKNEIAKKELPFLEKELQKAEKEVEDLRKYEFEIKEKYNKIKDDIKNITIKIRQDEKKLQALRKEQRKLLKKIKIVDRKFESNKSISKILLNTMVVTKRKV